MLDSAEHLINAGEANHSVDSLKHGQPSPTTVAQGSFSRIISIPTPYGPIGLTVPASFPLAGDRALLGYLKEFFQGLHSGDEGRF